MFYCEVCYSVFSSEKRLFQHQNKELSCGSQYNCKHCNMRFNHKHNYIRHLSSKKHQKNAPKSPENVAFVPENVTILPENVTLEFNCEICNKGFARKDNRDAHQLKCQGVVNPLQCPKCLKIFSSRSHKSRHCKTVNCTPIVVADARAAGTSAGPSTINNIQTQNNDNSVTNNNNITNNVHIHINAFKNENLDYILGNVEKMNKYISSALPGFQKLVKDIHFNDEHPENKNVRIKNIRSSLAEYFNGEKWVFENKQVVVEDLVNMCMAHIHKFLQSDEASDQARRCHEHLNEWLESSDENVKTYQKIRSDTMYTIANNT